LYVQATTIPEHVLDIVSARKVSYGVSQMCTWKELIFSQSTASALLLSSSKSKFAPVW
jgi:hypothetical protein